MLLFLSLITSTPELTFLDLFPGAFATGLAGCATAVFDNPTVTYYNPAGLAFLDGDNFTLTHAHLQPKWADISGAFDEFFSFTTPLTSRCRVGLSGLFFVRGATEIFSLKEATGFDADIGFGLGYQVIPKVAVGITPKYIYSMNLTSGAETKDWTLAADFGALWTVVPRLTVAAVVQNIGNDIHYDNRIESRALPRRFKLGFKFVPVAAKDIGLFFTPELEVPFDTTRIGAGIGAELNWRTIVFVRGGVLNDEHRRGFAYGFGCRYKRLKVDVGTDENLFPKRRMYWKFTLSYKS
jgi:hypothetical protein